MSLTTVTEDEMGLPDPRTGRREVEGPVVTVDVEPVVDTAVSTVPDKNPMTDTNPRHKNVRFHSGRRPTRVWSLSGFHLLSCFVFLPVPATLDASKCVFLEDPTVSSHPPFYLHIRL